MKRERESDSDAESSAVHNFGFYVFNEISVLLYKRTAMLLSQMIIDCVKSEDVKARAEKVLGFRDHFYRSVTVLKAYLDDNEYKTHQVVLEPLVEEFCRELGTTISEENDRLAMCKRCLKCLENNGFPDLESVELDQLLIDLKHESNVLGYSYSKRPSLHLPLIPRYDGDRKQEGESSRERQGFQVVLADVHKHPEINTRYQLSEPKKRKPLLDEGKIFSHPKKVARYGTEDFLVDEELLHRSYVVLQNHLDTFGTLEGISPYSRFALWNIVERDDEVFGAVCDRMISNANGVLLLRKIRTHLETHLRCYDAVRDAARRAAQQVGWYAVSAQWRDQVLHKLESLAETDWYNLSDCGSKYPFRFPNYGKTRLIVKFAKKLVEHLSLKEDKRYVESVVKDLLLPLLAGSPCKVPKGVEQWTANHSSQLESLARKDFVRVADGGNSTERFLVCRSLVFPLQCMSELLELCALSQFSKLSTDVLLNGLVRTGLASEESIVAFLASAEPFNIAVAPLVALPQVLRDLEAALTALKSDKLLPLFVEMNNHSKHGKTDVFTRWAFLSAYCRDLGRIDDIFLYSPCSDDLLPGSLYHLSELQLCPLVLKEEVDKFISQENKVPLGGGKLTSIEKTI